MESSALEVSSFLRVKKDLLFAAWGNEVLELSSDAAPSELAFVNYFPQLIDELAEAIEVDRGGFAREAQRHRILRYSRGISVRCVENEYTVLRRVVHRTYREGGGIESLERFDDALDDALTEASGAYSDEGPGPDEREREGSSRRLNRPARSAA